jgi:hypothetical protein
MKKNEANEVILSNVLKDFEVPEGRKGRGFPRQKLSGPEDLRFFPQHAVAEFY